MSKMEDMVLNHEFFIVANSNAAPMVSDESVHYVEAISPSVAMDIFREQYKHPLGLYSAAVYTKADDYHKAKEPLLQWLSDKAKAQWKKLGLG